MRARKRAVPTFELPLIPMIDCMLVIIIFFLIASTLKKPPKTEVPPPKTKDLPLILPEATSGTAAAPDSEFLVIGVDDLGNPYLGLDRVSTTDLHARLREVAAANPQQPIRIKADRLASFESVVRVIDLCEFEGLNHIVLHTREVRGYGIPSPAKK
jgi:biopolymer transport protein ExbD